MLESLSRRSAMGMIFAGVCAQSSAQSGGGKWPDRPVKLVVPAPAGGAADYIARTVGNALSEIWGQPVIVENRPGGGGTIGAQGVVRSAADGYTLLGGWGYLIQMPSMTDRIPYDFHKDLTPISQLVETDDLLVVPASLNVKTMAEFIKHVKENAGKTSMGIYGLGSSSHLHAELLKKEAGLSDMTTVPFQGISPLMTALLGEQLTSGWVDVSGSRAHHTTGKLRFLAKSGLVRSTLLPDVPTFTELGLKGFEPSGFMGLFAPSSTPADLVNKIAADVQKVMQRPEMQQRFMETGTRPNANGPKEFANMLRRDEKIWGAIARGARIRID